MASFLEGASYLSFPSQVSTQNQFSQRQPGQNQRCSNRELIFKLKLNLLISLFFLPQKLLWLSQLFSFLNKPISQYQMTEDRELRNLFAKQTHCQSFMRKQDLQNFMESSDNISLAPNFQALLELHRDGNSFYRAIAFLYLRNIEDLSHYSILFPNADLLKCRNLPIAIPKNYTSNQLLCYIWKRYLLALNDQCQADREMRLQFMMNFSLAADSILIAYFRVLTYQYVLRNKLEFYRYIDGEMEASLNRILTFGEESQGFEIFAISKVLNIPIEVYVLHGPNLQIFQFNCQAKQPIYKLLHHPNQYDILCARRKLSKQGEIVSKQFRKLFMRDNSKAQKRLLYAAKNQTTQKIISVSRPSDLVCFNFSSQRAFTQENRRAIINKMQREDSENKSKRARQMRSENLENGSRTRNAYTPIDFTFFFVVFILIAWLFLKIYY